MSHSSPTATPRCHRSPVALAIAAWLAGMGYSAPAWTADLFVNSDATLRSAITSAVAGDRIVFQNSITLAADLPTVGTNVTIAGNGNTLSGNNQFRGLFIGGFSGTTQAPVAVTITDLTIADARAQGGNSASAPGTGSGGGGAGLGGALFVANQATLTVSNVTLTNNAAAGGAGGQSGSAAAGGGGMGGNSGSTVGGGGGLGVGATGGNNNTAASAGIATGAAGGGTGGAGAGGGTAGGANGGGGGGAVSGGGGSAAGGGVGGQPGIPSTGPFPLHGGAGGFGGGGGAGAGGGSFGGAGGFGGGGGSAANGGAGGFGGGGGGGGASGGVGGFGGGNGGGAGIGGGGGGAGLGGGVFVQQGGTLQVAGAFSVGGGIVTAGASGGGAGGATAGSAFGAGIFLQGNGTAFFTPGASVTQTVADVIADQTGSGGTGGNAGSWGLSKGGAGTLVLSAANTYSGGTTVTGGLVNFAAASLGSGEITLNGGGLQWAAGNASDVSAQLGAIGAGGGTLDTNGNTVAFAAPVAGTGGLAKAGTGTLTLSGANTYSGGTTVSAGTLALAPGASLPAGSTLTVSGGTFATNGSVSVGALSGTAGAINLGAGVLTTDSAASTTLAAAITGAGGLAKAGTGTLNLAGTHGYTGATSVNGGTLAANGTLASAVTVNNGGTLGGTGSVGGASILAGGVFAPGNSIGTITVGGNVGFAAGSIYRVEADAAGNADRINATGTATLSGGTVEVLAAAGSYQRNTTYTILNATGGVAGRFDTVTSNLAFLDPALAYDANNVLLTLTRNNVALGDVAVTPNQRAVAGHLELVAADPGAAALLAQVDGLTAEQARAAFTSLGGDSLSALATVAMSESRRFLRLLGGRLTNPGAGTGLAYSGVQLAAAGYRRSGDGATMGAGPADGPASGRGFWAQVTGSHGNVDGDGNASGFDWNASNLAVGLDTELARGTVVGAAFGYGQANVDLAAGGSGTVQSPRFGLYGSRASGPWTFRGAAGYADQDFDSRRSVAVGADTSTASGSHQGKEWSFSAEAEYTVARPGYQVKPLAGLVYVNLKEDGYTESGSNAALAVAGRTTESITSLLGLRYVRPAGSGTFEARAVWSHEFGDTGPAIAGRLAAVPAGPSFTVAGVPIERDALTLGVGFSGQAARNLSVYADINVEIRGSGQSQYMVMGGLRYAF